MDELTKLLETIDRLLERVEELESVIQSHGIPVKTYSGNVAHYCRGNRNG